MQRVPIGNIRELRYPTLVLGAGFWGWTPASEGIEILHTTDGPRHRKTNDVCEVCQRRELTCNAVCLGCCRSGLDWLLENANARRPGGDNRNRPSDRWSRAATLTALPNDRLGEKPARQAVPRGDGLCGVCGAIEAGTPDRAPGVSRWCRWCLWRTIRERTPWPWRDRLLVARLTHV
jgi:hypothetical protein